MRLPRIAREFAAMKSGLNEKKAAAAHQRALELIGATQKGQQEGIYAQGRVDRLGESEAHPRELERLGMENKGRIDLAMTRAKGVQDTAAFEHPLAMEKLKLKEGGLFDRIGETSKQRRITNRQQISNLERADYRKEQRANKRAEGVAPNYWPDAIKAMEARPEMGNYSEDDKKLSYSEQLLGLYNMMAAQRKSEGLTEEDLFGDVTDPPPIKKASTGSTTSNLEKKPRPDLLNIPQPEAATIGTLPEETVQGLAALSADDVRKKYRTKLPSFMKQNKNSYLGSGLRWLEKRNKNNDYLGGQGF